MTSQEMAEAVEAAGIPDVAKTEKYYDSAQYVGGIYGETVRSPNPIALAFRRACGMGQESEEDGLTCQSVSPETDCCGVACDSDCSCPC